VLERLELVGPHRGQGLHPERQSLRWGVADAVPALTSRPPSASPNSRSSARCERHGLRGSAAFRDDHRERHVISHASKIGWSNQLMSMGHGSAARRSRPHRSSARRSNTAHWKLLSASVSRWNRAQRASDVAGDGDRCQVSLYGFRDRYCNVPVSNTGRTLNLRELSSTDVR
jgi:hypothetical protein